MRRRLVAVAALAALVACFSGKDPLNPGTPLGTYHVDGKLKEASCGDGAGAPASWPFDIHLAQDHATLFWIQGGAPVSGIMDAANHVAMDSSDTRTIHEANPRAALGFCSMTRDDALDLTLAKDTLSFHGTLVYRFSATDGSDCTDQLTSAGGMYAALPCTVTYDLSGTRTAAPPATTK